MVTLLVEIKSFLMVSAIVSGEWRLMMVSGGIGAMLILVMTVEMTWMAGPSWLAEGVSILTG
jgi:hypothetical protein